MTGFKQTSIPAKLEGDSNYVNNFLANRQHEIAIYLCTSREMHFNKIENELKSRNWEKSYFLIKIFLNLCKS